VLAPTIQVSWGELVDRITILEIKEQRLQSKDAVANVRDELAALMSIAQNTVGERSELAALKSQLKSVNEVLWEIEDKIRAKEAGKSFDREFIELARSVYINNDKRGELKRRINVLLNSSLGEQKQYIAYSK
jgi:phenylalanyl-tRNA synthetase alpha subunit